MIQLMVPYFGDPGMAIETLESVRAQTSDRWQLVVVDDADPSTEVRDWVARTGDQRITYERNERNLGVLGNFRRALSLASAEWVSFLGCDDRLRPDHVATVLQVADASTPDVVAVQPGVAVIDEHGRPSSSAVDTLKRRLSPPPGVHRGEPLARSLVQGNWTYFPSIAWRRTAVQDVGFSDYEVVLDLALLLDLVLAGGALVHDERVTFEYRRHAASASSAAARAASRFDEERDHLTGVARELHALGWTSAGRAARVRWTSRAHAVSLVPRAVAGREWPTVRRLVRHGVGA